MTIREKEDHPLPVATETLTIHLPVQAAQRLRRVGEIAHRPIDDVIADTLHSALPPLLDNLPPAFQIDLAQLEAWSNEALRQQVFAVFDADSTQEYDDLLEKQQDGALTEQEQPALAELRTKSDLLMFRKVYVALLLKWRGERVPSVTKLEASVHHHDA